MTPQALASVRALLPLRVVEILWTPENVVVSGGTVWSLMVMCPLRFRTPEGVLDEESPDLEDRLWDLVGRDLERIDVVGGEPVFGFGEGWSIEVFADTDWDPWVLGNPAVTLVGVVPEGGPRSREAAS